jgi:hypothetical protein
MIFEKSIRALNLPDNKLKDIITDEIYENQYYLPLEELYRKGYPDDDSLKIEIKKITIDDTYIYILTFQLNLQK